MKCICFYNTKGGVAKTTNTLELGTVLSQRAAFKHAKPVLLIDLDQQCNLTTLSKIKQDGVTIYELLKADNLSKEEIKGSIQKSPNGYDIIPGSRKLEKSETSFGSEKSFALYDLIKELEDDYSYILIDNAPANGLLINMCYLISDYAIVCMDDDVSSIDGMKNCASRIQTFKSRSNTKIIGTIQKGYQGYNQDIAVLEMVKKWFKQSCPPEVLPDTEPFTEYVRQSKAVPESHSFKKSIQLYKKSSNPAIDYRRIADKLIEMTKEI